MAQLGNLIVNGVARLLSKLYVSDSVTAPTFIGKLQGKADSATSADTATKLSTSTAGTATQPVYFKDGKPVATTYTLGKSVPSDAKFTDTNTTYGNFKAATASAAGGSGLVPAPAAGKQGQYLRGDGTWATPTNTTYSAVTQSANGLMIAADKKKLDGIAEGANKYALPTATSSVLGGVKTGSNITNSSGTISLTKANVTSALGYTPPTTNTTYSAATQSANGLMSSGDKKKLDGLPENTVKTYSLSGPNGDNKHWVHVGDWSSSDANSCHIIVYTGDGWNARPNQNSVIDIFIKDSFQNPSSTTSAYGVSVSRKQADPGKSGVRVVATDYNKCQVWLWLSWDYGLGYYTVDYTPGSSWTNVGTAQTDEPSGGVIQTVCGDLWGSCVAVVLRPEWWQGTGPYTYTISFPGMMEDWIPGVPTHMWWEGLSNDDLKTRIYEMRKINMIKSTTDYLTFTAFEEKPECALDLYIPGQIYTGIRHSDYD